MSLNSALSEDAFPKVIPLYINKIVAFCCVTRFFLALDLDLFLRIPICESRYKCLVMTSIKLFVLLDQLRLLAEVWNVSRDFVARFSALLAQNKLEGAINLLRQLEELAFLDFKLKNLMKVVIRSKQPSKIRRNFSKSYWCFDNSISQGDTWVKSLRGYHICTFLEMHLKKSVEMHH